MNGLKHIWEFETRKKNYVCVENTSPFKIAINKAPQKKMVKSQSLNSATFRIILPFFIIFLLHSLEVPIPSSLAAASEAREASASAWSKASGGRWNTRHSKVPKKV